MGGVEECVKGRKWKGEKNESGKSVEIKRVGGEKGKSH